jgi:GNAT superfamily N-acetyltransferase
MANSDLAIGRLALAELPDAEVLVAEAGWNQVAADWRMFLDFGTTYAVRTQGRVVATAAWIPYSACAWISMVLVTATARRRGLATRLLHRCIADVTRAGLVPVLDATPAGAKVYAPLGFREAWGFARFASERRVIWPAETSAGMLLGRDGRTASHLGPLIAEDDVVAKALLARALSSLSGTVYVDVADAKPGVRAYLEASGFSVQRPFTRMLLGRDEGFDDAARTYAVIGPEFG